MSKTTKVKPTYRPEAPESQKSEAASPMPSPMPLPESALSTIQCAVIGDQGIGKTTLLQKLGEKSLPSQSQFGQRYDAQITARRGERFQVTYVECSSHDDYSRLRFLTYKSTQIFFICFSTVNRSSYESALLQWYPEIQVAAPEAPVYLLGTQADLRDEVIASGATLVQDVVRTEEGLSLAQQIEAVQYLETAAGNSEQLTKAIKQIAEAFLRQFERDSDTPSAWKQILPGSHTVLSPKEDHQRSIRRARRKKKESVAVLDSRKSTPIQKLTKMAHRRSALPISFDDLWQDENIDSRNHGDALSPKSPTTPSKKKLRHGFPLRQLRQTLVRMMQRQRADDDNKPTPTEQPQNAKSFTQQIPVDCWTSTS